MTDRMKAVLERTEKTLCRHLEDLNYQVDQDGGRIKDHMVLDGIKDVLKSVHYLMEIMPSNGESMAVKASKTIPGMV